MSKPDDIPQDVWDLATAVSTGKAVDPGGTFSETYVVPMARVILATAAAERENIAAMADAMAKVFEPLSVSAKDDPYQAHDIGRRDGAAAVAAAIRKRGETLGATNEQ